MNKATQLPVRQERVTLDELMIEEARLTRELIHAQKVQAKTKYIEKQIHIMQLAQYALQAQQK